MPVALPAIRDLLLPGLWAVTGKYPQLPRVWNRIFDSRPSKMALERMQSTSTNRTLGRFDITGLLIQRSLEVTQCPKVVGDLVVGDLVVGRFANL